MPDPEPWPARIPEPWPPDVALHYGGPAVTVAELTDTEREIQGLVREFARAEIAPRSQEWNEAHHVPVEVLRRMAELGLLGVIIPEEYGGAGLGYACLAIVDGGGGRRRRRDARPASRCRTPSARRPILRAGTDAQKEALPADLASGARFAAYALTEPDAGSDTANIRTTARADGDGWLVNGAKQWITNGGFASVFVLYARTGGPGAKGISCFLAEPGEGFTVGARCPSSGSTPRPPWSWPSTATASAPGR